MRKHIPIFSLISDIVPEDESTWADKVFITLDIDWCHDDVLNHAIDLLENSDIAATWYVTHDTPVLDRLRENPQFELGIHPNFNGLLDGDLHNYNNGSNMQAVIDKILNLVPEATSVRSHALTQNTNMLNLFTKAGLTHDSNHYIPAQSNIDLRPWSLWHGLIKVPIFWEDDLTCLYYPDNPNHISIENLLKRNGLKVFDFHPIHLFLNSKNMTLYNETRPIHHDLPNLTLTKNTSFGVFDMFQDLIGTSSI